ncbi:anti-sigma factor [bacterium]|nr:MAG: anti-sigma factor [bacterium]
MNNEQFNSEPETPQDAHMRQLLQSHLLVASPSEALRERIARSVPINAPKTAVSPTRPVRVRTVRFALSTVAVALLITGGSIVWPRVMAQQALARVEEAVSKVSTMHCVMYRIEGSKRIKDSEKWFDKGNWRSESVSQGLTTLYINGTRWSYRKKLNTVTIHKDVQLGQPLALFTLTDFIQHLDKPTSEANQPKRVVTFQGTTTQNGRTLKRVQLDITNSIETSKVLLLVDAETDLPVSADIQARDSRGHNLHGLITYSYNQPLEPGLFKPNFGSSVRLIDFDEEIKKAQERQKVLATQANKTLNKSDLTIHALEVNSHGSVFLSYKDSFAGRGILVFISDSMGTNYRWGGNLSPTLPGDMETPRMRSQWWTPATGSNNSTKWKPRTFRVQFKLLPRNTKRFVADSLDGVEFSIPVRAATATIVPPLTQKLNRVVGENEIIQKEHKAQNAIRYLSQPK